MHTITSDIDGSSLSYSIYGYHQSWDIVTLAGRTYPRFTSPEAAHAYVENNLHTLTALEAVDGRYKQKSA